MTPERLAEIEARAEAATPGEWVQSTYAGGQVDRQVMISGVPKMQTMAAIGNASDNRWADIAFIAHSRQDIPDLIAEVKRLREIVGDFEIATEGWREDNQG